MRLIAVYITLFVAICCSTTNTLTPTSSISNIEKSCLDTLKLEKRDYIFDERYSLKKLKRSQTTIIIETLKDSVPSDVLTSTEKEKLINAFTRLKAAETKKLTTVKPKTACGLYFDNSYSNNTLEINSNYSFYVPDGFVKTKEIDKESTILQKYKDSSFYFFSQKPLVFDRGSLYKFQNKENQYYLNNYETYSNDGGSFWTVYKISNILNYDTKGWLRSAIQFRSFFKHYSSEEKRFTTDIENEKGYRNTKWNYTFLDTELDKSNSFIEHIDVYYIELDNEDLSEQVYLTIQKECLTFKKNT